MKTLTLKQKKPKTLNLKRLGLLCSLGVFVFSIANEAFAQSSSWGKNRNNAEEEAVAAKKKRSDSDDDYTPSSHKGNLEPFAPGSNNLSLQIGQIFLMGKLGGAYEDSLGFRLNYTYGVSDLFGFNAALGYSEHSEGELSILSMNAGVRMNLNWYDKIIPHAIFGMGFYRPSEGTGGNSVSAIVFGLYAGVGVDLQITHRLFFGASLTYNNMFSSRKSTPSGPRDLGGSYTAFLVHAGLTF